MAGGAFHREDPELMEALSDAELAQMRRALNRDTLAEISRRMQDHGIRLMTLCDPDYPVVLPHISDPPIVLFYQGEPSTVRERSLAVVGSRRASWQGLRATEQLTERLSGAGVTIISGLAYGIDTAAHQGCLKGKSPTVAVLGCGLDIVYPCGNKGLKTAILNQGGLFLSEYLPGKNRWPIIFQYATGSSAALDGPSF